MLSLRHGGSSGETFTLSVILTKREELAYEEEMGHLNRVTLPSISDFIITTQKSCKRESYID